MNFESCITKAEWVDADGKWEISVEQKQVDGSMKTFVERCDIFLYATGILNNYKMPDIKGLNKFQGQVCYP